MRATMRGEWCSPDRILCRREGALWDVSPWADATAEALHVRVQLPLLRVTECSVTRVEVRSNHLPSHAFGLGAFNADGMLAPTLDTVIVPRTPPNEDRTIVLELRLQPLQPCAVSDLRVLGEMGQHGCTARSLIPRDRAVLDVMLPATNDKEHDYAVVVDTWASTPVCTSVPPPTPRRDTITWSLGRVRL
jgi:hypothetical protein